MEICPVSRRWDGGARPQLSIVVPAYNEMGRLGRSLPTLVELASTPGYEVIAVDDGSIDGTGARLADQLRGMDGATLVRFSSNRGKGAAVRAGIERARGTTVMFMDADLATDMGDLPRLLAGLEGADLSVGSRAVEGARVADASRSRVHMGRTFNHLARAVTGVTMRDTQCGFKAFRAPVAKLLFHLSTVQGFAFDVEILALARSVGYRVTEVPVNWRAVEGTHVRTLRDPTRMAFDLLLTRVRWRPRRLLAVLRAFECDDAVLTLKANLRAADSVVQWRDGALALLPCVDPTLGETVASRVRDRAPDFRVTASMLPVSLLLHPSSADFRQALLAA